MLTSNIRRVCGLCVLAVTLPLGCSDTGTSGGDTPAAGQGPGPGPGGSGSGSAGTPSSGGANAGSAGASASGAPGAGNGSGGVPAAGAAGTPGGGAGGDAAGTAGAGGGGGAGGTPPGFAPCNSAPAATPPMLTKGPAINGFGDMLTAGQMLGVPGEADLLYVIGHRDGNVFVVQGGEVLEEPLVHVNVANGGNSEQGLLSMALHPNFATNHLFYLYYTATGGGALTIDEFERLTPTTAMFKQNIFSTPREGGGEFHNGGALAFNPKDATPFLYVSLGNTSGNNAGDPNGNTGRILKFDVATKAKSQVAYGFRNPYRMSIDRLTGHMYIGDAANGSGGTIILHTNGKAVTDYLYRNNNGQPDVNEGILRDGAGGAIIGGIVYRGNKIPGLCGRFFFGNHQGGTVKSFAVDENGARVGNPVTHQGLQVPGDITSFGEDGEGELYMASMNNNIYKIIAQ
jgi:glucose/arabinose dehydrogenase